MTDHQKRVDQLEAALIELDNYSPNADFDGVDDIDRIIRLAYAGDDVVNVDVDRKLSAVLSDLLSELKTAHRHLSAPGADPSTPPTSPLEHYEAVLAEARDIAKTNPPAGEALARIATRYMDDDYIQMTRVRPTPPALAAEKPAVDR